MSADSTIQARAQSVANAFTGDYVAQALGAQSGGSHANSGAGSISAAVAGADPTLGYVQAGAAALQAVASMSQNPPQTTNTSYNHAPVNITYGDSSGISSTNTPTNTPNIATGQSAGGLVDVMKYAVIGLVVIVAVKTFRKAA